MFSRSLKQKEIVPAIVTGQLPTDRGPLAEYDNFEALHAELLAHLKNGNSAFRAYQKKQQKENFLYLDSKKRALPDDDDRQEDLQLKQRSRSNLVHLAHEYAAQCR